MAASFEQKTPRSPSAIGHRKLYVHIAGLSRSNACGMGGRRFRRFAMVRHFASLSMTLGLSWVEDP